MEYYNLEKYKLAPIFKVNNDYTGNYYALRTQYTEEQIIKWLKILNYSNENFAILAGDENYLRKTNPLLFKEKKMRNSRKDDRSVIEYYLDLVSGWIYEDLIAYSIIGQNPNIKIKLAGGDSTRSIEGHKVTNDADFQIFYKNNWRNCELSISHKGFFYYKKDVNLRLNKREHIIKQNSLLLLIETFAVHNNNVHYNNLNYKPMFVLLEPKDLETYKKNIKFNKSCDLVSFSNKELIRTNFLADEIIKILESETQNESNVSI